MTPDERWDVFLAKLRGRADDILAEAGDGSTAFIASPDFDPNAMSQLWTALRLRLIELRRKIEDSWTDSASALFDDAAGERARARGDRGFDAALALRAAAHDPARLHAYWRTYLTAVAEVLPERAATLDAEVAAKVAARELPRR